jgi:hypothetical protein
MLEGYFLNQVILGHNKLGLDIYIPFKFFNNEMISSFNILQFTQHLDQYG